MSKSFSHERHNGLMSHPAASKAAHINRYCSETLHALLLKRHQKFAPLPRTDGLSRTQSSRPWSLPSFHLRFRSLSSRTPLCFDWWETASLTLERSTVGDAVFPRLCLHLVCRIRSHLRDSLAPATRSLHDRRQTNCHRLGRQPRWAAGACAIAVPRESVKRVPSVQVTDCVSAG